MHIFRSISLIFLGFTVFSCSNPTTQAPIKDFAARDALTSRISAHRGGKNLEGHAENCLATMKYLHEKYPDMMFEIDLQLTQDHRIVLFHDDGLDRLTGTSGRVDLMNYSDLKKIPLIDDFGNPTDCRIPLFLDVLKWADKEDVTLWIDFKRSVSYERVINYLHEYNAEDNSILISYTMGQAEKLHHLAPDIQLSVTGRNMEEWERVVNSDIDLNRVVVFTGTRLSDKKLLDAIHEKGAMALLGTLGNLDNKASANGDELYRKWIAQGYDLFSTDRPVAVYEAIHE